MAISGLEDWVVARAAAESAVRIFRAQAEPPPVSDPPSLEEAVRQLNLLRTRVSEASQQLSASYLRINELDRENRRHKAGYEALRDLLRAYAEQAGGWHQGPLVPPEDFAALQAAAGL